MPAPDFPTGAEILYDRANMESVYRTGRGSIPVRAKWRYLQKENLIEITILSGEEETAKSYLESFLEEWK